MPKRPHQLTRWEKAARTRKANEERRIAEAAEERVRAAFERAPTLKEHLQEAQAPVEPSSRPLRRYELAQHIGKFISQDRNQTHGDPHDQFATAQGLKAILSQALAHVQARTGRLPPTATSAESIDLICTKLSRLVHGQDLQDTWLDIAGYALIAAEQAKSGLMTEHESAAETEPA